jgi:hypothetical protein
MTFMKIQYRKGISFLAGCALLFSVNSCQLTDLDINTDPNNPVAASPNLILTNVVLEASNTFAGLMNQNTHGFVGILASSDRFDLNNQTYNFTWNFLYSDPLKDLDELIKATEDGTNPHYLGIAQVLKAYYFSLMVDMWGDVPYSEAFQGNAASLNKYPKYDSGQEIYADLFRLLDAALENFEKGSPVAVLGDPIYNGNVANWKKAAKSLKLRLVIQTRRVDADAAAKAAALANDPDLIQSSAQDFIFQFSSMKNRDPDDRHPWYRLAYKGAESTFNYILHQFMVEMLDNEDPRVPYYFKRQTGTILDQNNPTSRNTSPCSNTPGCQFGYLVLNPNIWQRLYTAKGITPTKADTAYLAGFFGRDRGDQAGVPLDGSLRTVPGVYPIGGLYDGTPSITRNQVGNGNGIFPMITSTMVKFYQLEAALTLGTSLAKEPADLFADAIREHITRVATLSATLDPASQALDAAKVDKYVDLMKARFTAAPSNEAKLNVVLKQAWFSNFGNGYEIYNAFRRTGYPNDLQIPLTRVRQFALRIPYAQDDLSLNQNAPASQPPFDATPVFWDVLKFQF